MSLIVRIPPSLTLILAAVALPALAAGAAPQQSVAVEPTPPARVAEPRSVDSLVAALRATVLDRTPIRVSDTAARGDTARAGATTGLGSRSGARHPAFGNVGSPLDTLWPVSGPEPLPGSILPDKRIVAFYGNPYSTRMGILGAYPHEEMLAKLDAEVAAWNLVDPAHPVQPALHLIVLVADPVPGPSGKYRTRHDSAMIERVYGWARSRNALLFLDLQVGQSTLQHELPWIEPFLRRPDVYV